MVSLTFAIYTLAHCTAFQPIKVKDTSVCTIQEMCCTGNYIMLQYRRVKFSSDLHRHIPEDQSYCHTHRQQSTAEMSRSTLFIFSPTTALHDKKQGNQEIRRKVNTLLQNTGCETIQVFFDQSVNFTAMQFQDTWKWMMMLLIPSWFP